MKKRPNRYWAALLAPLALLALAGALMLNPSGAAMPASAVIYRRCLTKDEH